MVSKYGFRYWVLQRVLRVGRPIMYLLTVVQAKIGSLLRVGLVLACLAQLVACAAANSLPPAPRLSNPAGHLQSVWSKGSLTNTHNQYLKMQPAVLAGQLYTADAGGKVTALSAATGRVLWANRTHTPITSGVAVGTKHVFVGTAAGDLLALSKANGRLQWFQAVSSSIIAPPVVGRSHVFIKTEGSDVYAYQTKQGHIIWNFPVPSPGLVLREGSAPALYGSQLVAGFANGQLASLSQQSGFPKWRKQLVQPQGNTVVTRMVDIDATPLIAGNTAYVASYQGKIAAIRAQTGRVIWQHHLSTFSGLALNNKAVFATDVSGRIWAFDRTSGRVLWKNTQLTGRGLGAPQVMQGRLFVGDVGGNLYAVSCATGRLQALTHMTRGAIIAAPMVYGDLVIVAASNGAVKAYRYTSSRA